MNDVMMTSSYLVGNLCSVLIQSLVADSLGQRDAGYPPRLSAGNLREAGGHEVLGHLGGLATARIPGNQHHLVRTDCADDLRLVVMDW